MVATENASLASIFLTILGQMGAIAVLHWVVGRRIQQLGTSELKQTLTPAG